MVVPLPRTRPAVIGVPSRPSSSTSALVEPLRAIVVTYAFPPVGGAGVQRMLKAVKYLPSHGVEPTVLTVKNPSVPVLDMSLEADVPQGIRVIRARTFEPGYALKQAAWAKGSGGTPAMAQRIRGKLVAVAKEALVPDAQVLWQPGAQAALARELWAGGVDAVLISAPPFSQFLLGPLARLSPGTAVVLDYRDEWSTYREAYEMAPALSRLVGGPLEALLLRSAHVVTTATERFRQALLERFSFLDPSAVRAIPNGYDPDDMPAKLPRPPADRLVLTYAGTVFKLTSPRGLMGAIRRLHQREPELAKLLRVRFFGRIVDTELAHFEGMEALGVERVGYVDHSRVIEELSASHAVLCMLDDVPGNERIYPGKVFELMSLRRPCLTLAPEGALAELVRGHNLGEVVPPRDETAIAASLERLLRAFKEGALPLESDVRDVERFSRKALAGEMAEALREARRRARGLAPRRGP